MAENDDHRDLRSRIEQLKNDHQALKAQLIELRDRLIPKRRRAN